jgi:hypothetical protein
VGTSVSYEHIFHFLAINVIHMLFLLVIFSHHLMDKRCISFCFLFFVKRPYDFFQLFFILQMQIDYVCILFYFSTKRVDHTNTRLSSQLERNPGLCPNKLYSKFLENLNLTLTSALMAPSHKGPKTTFMKRKFKQWWSTIPPNKQQNEQFTILHTLFVDINKW